MLFIRVSWGKQRPPEHGHCPHCQYDLQGLIRARCPECGRSTLHSRQKQELTTLSEELADTLRFFLWCAWLIALLAVIVKSLDYFEQLRFGMMVICGFAIIGLLLPIIYKWIS